jgi:hypothetical protein
MRRRTKRRQTTGLRMTVAPGTGADRGGAAARVL